MNQKQSSVTETTSLNAEALHEISRLQENILQTLRNELKKLKEPEVMGASNVSTPVHEIGEDMTPLPSLTVSAANFLKPVRQFSPMTPQRRIMRKLRPIQTKRPLDNSQTPGIKYNYKLRDYPRPWAELPQRKRTISEESLEVHVTTSHFSDMSNFELSVTESGEVARVEEVPSTHEALQVLPQEDQDRVIPSAPDVDRTESSERWKKSIIFKSKPSKVLKYGINSKTSLMRTCSKPCGQPCQSPNTIINQAFVHQVLVNKSPTKSSPRGIRKVVVFPAPLQESKKLKLKNLAALQSSNKYGLPLQLFESSDETNNNFLQDTSAEIEISSKAVCERLNETRMLCDLVYQKLKKSRSVQVFTQKDETVQTDAIPGSFSSEFELGLFIATLIDELIDAACEVTFLNVPRQSIKSNSHNYSPGKTNWRSGSTQRRGVHDTHIPVPTNRYSRTRSEVNRPEPIKTIRRYNKAREEIKSPVKYVKPVKDTQDEQMSSRKLSRGENFLVKKCSRSYREGSVPSSIKRALKSITESPTPKKVTPLHSNRCSMKSPAIESCKNEAKCLPYHLSEPESDDNGSLENSNFEENFKSFHNTLGSFLDKNVTKGMHSKKDKGLLQKLGLVEKHLSNRQHQQQLLSSLKSRRKKSAKIKKKLWWLFDSEYLDSSQGTPSLSSLKSFLPGHEIDCERVQDYFTIREDFSDSSGPDASSQVRQNSSRLSILKYPYGKTSRKRNIKMSYNPPDFSDLFPYAGTILAEASQFMPRMIPNTGRIIAHRKNAAVVSNRLLTPIWPK